MFKLVTAILAVLLLPVALWASGGNVAAPDHVSVSSRQAGDCRLLIVGEEFPPYEFVDKSGHITGMDVEIASTILQKLGVEHEFMIMPWKRAWMMVKEGSADASLTTSRKPDRKPFLYYPDEDMWTSEFVFFVRKETMEGGFYGYRTIYAKQLRVGIIAGNSYHPHFWGAFPPLEGENELGSHHPLLDEARDAEHNMRKLAHKRIDAFPIDRRIGYAIVKKLGLEDQITHYPVPLFSKDYPMPFARRSACPRIKEIADSFEVELRAMKRDGRYQSILERWFETSAQL